MAAIDKEKVVTYILAELEKNTSRGTALTYCQNKWQLNTRTFDRYWKEGKDRYSELHHAAQKVIEDRTAQLIVERQEGAILSKETALQGLTADFYDLGRLRAGNKILVLGENDEILETITPTVFDEVRAKGLRMQIVEKMAEMEGWSGVVSAPASVSISNNVQNNTTVVSRSITFKTRKTTMQPQSIQDEANND